MWGNTVTENVQFCLLLTDFSRWPPPLTAALLLQLSPVGATLLPLFPPSLPVSPLTPEFAFISWLDLGLTLIFLLFGDSIVEAVFWRLFWFWFEIDIEVLVFPWLEVAILHMASDIVCGETQSSGSQSRKPLAKGLLAIFNWVIWKKDEIS